MSRTSLSKHAADVMRDRGRVARVDDVYARVLRVVARVELID
jgi:hypothetical protein